MMDMQLIIDGKLADYDSQTIISLNREFDNEKELIVKEAEYSYTIDLPTSDRNRAIFGYTSTFDVPNKFSRTYDAELYADGIQMLVGKLKLNEIDGDSFKGNLYSPAKQSITDILGDKMLNEINAHMKPMNSLDDINRQNNYVAGFMYSLLPPPPYRDRHVCYPYVLYSQPKNLGEYYPDRYTQDVTKDGCGLSIENIFPAFNVLSVLKDMFSTFGYKLQGNIFGDWRFEDLYQTFQYAYSDYASKRLTPYYVDFSVSYDNYRQFNIPETMQVATIWTEAEADVWKEAKFDGTFQYGVDVPLQAGDKNTQVTVRSNPNKMLAKGDEYDGYGVFIPVDGWYKIRCKGNMLYPDQSSNYYYQENRDMVGGTSNEADNTDLSEQPFEFQIKKGDPASNPQLYSFNSTIPLMPSNYNDGVSVRYTDTDDSPDYGTYIKIMNDERCRRYGKNGKTTIVKDYSDFPTDDFIAGARLGGAWFSSQWPAGGTGACIRRPNRFAKKGAMLALPDVTKAMVRKEINGDQYFKLTDENGNSRYEYADRTAQILVRNDSYSEFEGYNVYDNETLLWDTVTNVGARHYAGADPSSAATSDNVRGEWEINTVVWLQRGDVVNFELLMPYNTQSEYTEARTGPFGRPSRWHDEHYHVNRTIVNFDFTMGIVSTDKEWAPTDDDPIPSFNDASKPKLTNVNQFLPNIKCNDYLNGFLQIFNLQLTNPSRNVYSIDYAMLNDLQGEHISIDGYAHVSDAVFKALAMPSTRELAFKYDSSEEGYTNGNDSPYRTGATMPWDSSGYTGNLVIENESDTSGSVDKKESIWSYDWYKTISFQGHDGMCVSAASVPVICSADNWKDAENKTYDTNRTMRLFLLSKNSATNLYEFMEFPYDSDEGQFYCKLLIPTNILGNGDRRYLLDFSSHGEFVGIADSFFNLYKQTGYQVDVPVALPNAIYNRMRAGTLVKFNDGLYRLRAIEGHDISGRDDGTISLITLK